MERNASNPTATHSYQQDLRNNNQTSIQPVRRSTRQKRAPTHFDEDYDPRPAKVPKAPSAGHRMPPKNATGTKGTKKATETSTTATKATKASSTTAKPKPAASKTKATAAKGKTSTTTKKASAAKAKVAAKTKVPAKPAPKPAPKPAVSRKRKADEPPERDGPPLPPTKKTKVEVNKPPTATFDTFVFGANTGAELGLGAQTTSASVRRPRLNPLLSQSQGGAQVVDFACGGMHGVALTADNRILTWGVNDHHALGRDTTWNNAPTQNADAGSSSSESEDEGGQLNPHESTPGEVDAAHFAPGTVFVRVYATDSATFALTSDGHVYGWGIFRAIDGPLGFAPGMQAARTPVWIPIAQPVVSLASGSNHMIALGSKGAVYTWGTGEQNQLGRRIVARTAETALKPMPCGLPKGIEVIGSGSEHGFAVHKNGKVYGWGSNNYGQTGVDMNIGDDNATIINPTVIPSLDGKAVTQITGGNHHSVALDEEGHLYVWGRAENNALGLDVATLPVDDDIVTRKGPNNRPVLVKPATEVPGRLFASVASGSDHVVAVGRDNKPYSWGFSAEYQTGQGTDDDVEMVTLVNNTAIRDRTVVKSGCGGQFSMLGAT